MTREDNVRNVQKIVFFIQLVLLDGFTCQVSNKWVLIFSKLTKLELAFRLSFYADFVDQPFLPNLFLYVLCCAFKPCI